MRQHSSFQPTDLLRRFRREVLLRLEYFQIPIQEARFSHDSGIWSSHIILPTTRSKVLSTISLQIPISSSGQLKFFIPYRVFLRVMCFLFVCFLWLYSTLCLHDYCNYHCKLEMFVCLRFSPPEMSTFWKSELGIFVSANT